MPDPKQRLITSANNFALQFQDAAAVSTIRRTLEEQHRYFLPTEILISQHGIVGMLIADTKPEKRNVTYTDSEWTGISVDTERWAQEFANDPVRRAHYVDTENGFSFYRIFALPDSAVQNFAKDRFLGNPMIEKCICDGVFGEGVELDEIQASAGERPISKVMPLIELLAHAGWQHAGLKEPADKGIINQYTQIWSWISFHGWFDYRNALKHAQGAMEQTIQNFDHFLQRFEPAPFAVVRESNHSLSDGSEAPRLIRE